MVLQRLVHPRLHLLLRLMLHHCLQRCHQQHVHLGIRTWYIGLAVPLFCIMSHQYERRWRHIRRWLLLLLRVLLRLLQLRLAGRALELRW